MQICKYNLGCECETQECEKCGWYPPVANRRERELRDGFFEKKYTIPFTGYCEVYAKSPEKAAEKADSGDMFFIEYNFGDPVCAVGEEDDELD